jgi:WD40 repeat protein
VDTTIRLWDVATRTCTAVLSGHASAVWSVAFSPDGRTLASGSRDGTVRLWDVASRACTATLTAHYGAVNCVAFCPKVRAFLMLSGLIGLIEVVCSCRTGRVTSTTCSQPSSEQWCGSWSVGSTLQPPSYTCCRWMCWSW